MALMKEIAGYQDYFVDTDGIVYTSKVSLRNNLKGELKPLKLSIKKTGYKYANMYYGNQKHQRSSLRVHRLVWLTFKGSIPEGWVIDHINGDKGDNRLENLQCITASENTAKYYQMKNKTK